MWPWPPTNAATSTSARRGHPGAPARERRPPARRGTGTRAAEKRPSGPRGARQLRQHRPTLARPLPSTGTRAGQDVRFTREAASLPPAGRARGWTHGREQGLTFLSGFSRSLLVSLPGSREGSPLFAFRLSLSLSLSLPLSRSRSFSLDPSCLRSRSRSRLPRSLSLSLSLSCRALALALSLSGSLCRSRSPSLGLSLSLSFSLGLLSSLGSSFCFLSLLVLLSSFSEFLLS